MKTKPFALAAVLLAIGAAVFFWSRREDPGVNGSASGVTVKMAYQPIVFGLPLAICEQNGLFKKHGVSVQSNSFTSANDMITALVGGEAHIVPSAPLVPVLSLESKYPGRFRIFAHSVMTSDQPFDRILVKNGSSIKSLGDIAGKRLALMPGTTALNTIKAYLKKNSISPDTINFVQLAPPAQLPALESDSIDALYAYEPSLTIALSKDLYRAISPSIYCSLIEPCPLVVSIIDREFERQHHIESKNAISALFEAYGIIATEPALASAALPAFTKIDPALAGKVSLQRMTLEGKINPENLQSFITILSEIGEIQDSIKVESLISPTP